LISRLQVALAAAALALLLPAALFGWMALEMGRPYAAWEGERADVTLEPGMSAGAMLRELHEAGVVRHPGLVRRWLSLSGGSDSLQAGEYRFEEPISPQRVMERLRAGDVILYGVTVPEGLWLEEVARQIAEQGFATEESLLAAFRDPDPVRDLDPLAEDLEGYLFPDTYHFPRGADAGDVVEAMIARFVSVADEDYRARAEGVGLSLREAVTLASLIERETSVAAERERISRVFHNRLERGMRLQCDPTVIYALHRAGRPVKRLYSKHLEFESPWNTYRVHGLPVGPIANPGEASLLAAVEPAEGPELYFVAAPGGGHQFSNDLGEHLRAVAEWRDYVRSSR
jgi:UPF0755 protein